MMALVQHNYKRLLGFHAVSQVGYMILGFGLGSAIGVAAGLFHMINNALYKSGLFLSAGCVEYRTGKENIDDLGGLSKAMPVTFFASLIFAMSISGVPPFNGFASKWMIYQGIIDFGSGSDCQINSGYYGWHWQFWDQHLHWQVLSNLSEVFSLAAVNHEFKSIKEVPVLMWIPLVILALFCIVFGVFATNLVVPKLFMPVTGEFQFTGFWNSSWFHFLFLFQLCSGIVIVYLATRLKNSELKTVLSEVKKFRIRPGYPTPEFYKTISGIQIFFLDV